MKHLALLFTLVLASCQISPIGKAETPADPRCERPKKPRISAVPIEGGACVSNEEVARLMQYVADLEYAGGCK